MRDGRPMVRRPTRQRAGQLDDDGVLGRQRGVVITTATNPAARGGKPTALTGRSQVNLAES
ncbi:hypothetical protein NITHO_2210001 [Nitrolancea hollandica Lb]|uniref:Uncharacterized protein n=1 Tax=Nitrolancea hollandica Lb TaxID=1129897 RepID=I4EF44_9BACT|nr:hypothetical protein NITHO_2210001 [Nitrolancea hollandica Lb]